MNVFVETNFVLELVLEQEQSESCSELLKLASRGAVRLYIPAYSLIEPYETLTRRQRDRKKLTSDLKKELDQLARSATLFQRVGSSQDAVNLLIESEDREMGQMEAVRAKLVGTATILPFDMDTLELSSTYQSQHDFSPQDAVVYASVIRCLRSDHQDESLFIDKNSRDFDDDDIRAELVSLKCKYLPRFDDAVRFVMRPRE